MNDLTILYITANRENAEFEEKIKNKLLEVSGDYPIVSISQEPIELGHNICVGAVGASYRNATMQLLVGAKYATTKYIAIAESDQLYPPGYFDVRPDYRLCVCRDLYVLKCWKTSMFYKKEFGDWTAIVDRLYFIKRLENQLNGVIEWGSGNMKKSTFRKRKWEWFSVGVPVITIKTPTNLSRITGTSAVCESELPYWGSSRDLSMSLGVHRTMDK